MFSIGKSINFIRDVCGDKSFSLREGLEAKGLALPKDDKSWLTYSDLSALTEVIQNINSTVSAHLLHILYTKHALKEHLSGN